MIVLKVKKSSKFSSLSSDLEEYNLLNYCEIPGLRQRLPSETRLCGWGRVTRNLGSVFYLQAPES